MRSLGAGAIALTVLLVAGCESNDKTGLECPSLAPGALSELAEGEPLIPVTGTTQTSGTVGRGGLVAHAVWLPNEATASASAQLSNADTVMIVYGPRDGQGGFSRCRRLELGGPGSAATATLDAREGRGGEYLVLVGPRPGAEGGDYTLSVTCAQGCDAVATPCPTLSQRGCFDVRCDGELVRDAQGCQTCDCRADALCDAGRRAGAGGACVLPGCECPADDSPVCGADGQTWPNACEARCAAVPVAREGRCEDVCPALAACEAPCYGLRTIEEGGCPGCDCAPDLPATAGDCAACPVDVAPTCGSDGVTYRNRCEAACAGVRILYMGACTESCRRPPEGCEQDCAFGLLPAPEDPDNPNGPCLQCACAGGPPATCAEAGAPVCVLLPGLTERTTVGSPCLAGHLDATEGAWGSCGESCETDADCADGRTCAKAGVFEGRCLLDATDCGCSSLEAPVCGADGATWDNPCLAACAEVGVVHLGPCCEDEVPTCDAEQVAALDRRGCPTGACVPADAALCSDAEPQVPGCEPDGTQLQETTCVAHLSGTVAATGWCTP